MRARTWFRIHSFTGVITGLLLFVICWSGTFAVLANEFDWLVTPELRVAANDEHASWGKLEAAVEDWQPEAELLRLQAPLYPVSAAHALVNLPDQRFAQAYVDPGAGVVTGHHSGLDLHRFFRAFHRRLLLGDVGLYLVSAFSLTLLTSLVAALCFYKRWWRRFLRLKPGSGRVFWSELHKTAGLWSLWFVLIMAVTGGWYLFEAARRDFGDGKIAYAGDPRFAVQAVPETSAVPAENRMPLDRLVTSAESARPDLDVRSVSFRDGAVVVAGQAGHVLVRDRANRVRLHAGTGEVLYEQNAGDLPLYWRWGDTADPLHFGDFGGLISKLIWFVFGLLLCGLVLTGTWLHAHRLAREAGGRRRHRWPGTMAALLVSVAVLAASAPAGFAQAREFFGPEIDGARQLPTLAPGVKIVMWTWIGVTLAIIAGWVYLLWRPEKVLRPGQHTTTRHARRDSPASDGAPPS